MEATVNLFSDKKGELNRFLSKIYNTEMGLYEKLSWQKNYKNPVEITELVGIYVDNYEDFTINLWVNLDNNIYIKVSKQNANALIKYIFERYPN